MFVLSFSEAERQNRMAALLERLHAKHNASRPWQETCKVVRQAMVRQSHHSVRENNLFVFSNQHLKKRLGQCSTSKMPGSLEPVELGAFIPRFCQIELCIRQEIYKVFMQGCIWAVL